MFDFQKLQVYAKATELNTSIRVLLQQPTFDRFTRDQLRRASFSIMLNIAEGSSRFSVKDRKNFLVIARGSAFECAAIMDYLMRAGEISRETYDNYFGKLEELSKMLYSLIKNQNNR
jgi:four helix bundle protein